MGYLTKTHEFICLKIIEVYLGQHDELSYVLSLTEHLLKVLLMMYSSCLDAPNLIKMQHIIEEVLLELIEVLLLVNFAVLLLKVLPMTY